MQADKRDKQKEEEHRNEYIPGVQEKTTIGGAYNTGVTSDDPEEKDEIEKQGSLAHLKPRDNEGKLRGEESSGS